MLLFLFWKLFWKMYSDLKHIIDFFLHAELFIVAAKLKVHFVSCSVSEILKLKSKSWVFKWLSDSQQH